MSIFNELLPKLNEISNTIANNFNDDLKAVFECLDKFEEEYQNGRGRTREKAQKDKMTTLQSINEDDDELNKKTETVLSVDISKSESVTRSSLESNNNEKPRRVSKKRSKHEMDDISSPEQDKRQKRNASVKAQSIISKQVNVNLNQKLRRDVPNETSKGNRKKDEENKENTEPVTPVQIKQEKISLPMEPMDMEPLPLDAIKQEVDKDEIAMPPPMAPVPKPRKGAAKEKTEVNIESSEDESSTRSRRSTRTRKQNDTAPVAAPRSTRASSRATKQPDPEQVPPPPDTRPKRTRGKKKVSEVPKDTESEKDVTQPLQESVTVASPAEKPRPKRTRRGKATEKEPKQEEIPELIQAKSERISQTEETNSNHSPILQPKEKTKSNLTKEAIKTKVVENSTNEIYTVDGTVTQTNIQLDETRIISTNVEMDKTVVIPNGVYNHAQLTPNNIRTMNETVVLETCSRETIVIEKQHVLDSTVVLDKDPKCAATMLTDDNSIMTDDNDEPSTPPQQPPPLTQPTSAVKEKVQQFEEMASRVTRTKTRAMAKKEEVTESQTPPDKISKPVLSADTLNKMNNMIFNGKPQQTLISSSASKPRANIVTSVKSFIPSSTSKLSAISKAKEAAEESLKSEKEDARKKKEAMLEAKREQQKRKREEKMAAAAAARSLAERERLAALHAAARDRLEKQAHADLGRAERLREAERKKQELARKVAETEERRKAEEQARQQRLADEQRRADNNRRKQMEEAEAMKKEAAIMAKEIEKRQKEYIEKQKLKHRLEMEKLRTPGTPGRCLLVTEPTYMADGFQHLNSDEDEEPEDRPVPNWSTSKCRKAALCVQSLVAAARVDRWFGVRPQTPDLRHIFPDIERARLKRTSSAVWRTPPPTAH